MKLVEASLLAVSLTLAGSAFAQDSASRENSGAFGGEALGNPFVPGGSDTSSDSETDGSQPEADRAGVEAVEVPETCELSYRRFGTVSIGGDPATEYYVLTHEDCSEELVTILERPEGL